MCWATVTYPIAFTEFCGPDISADKCRTAQLDDSNIPNDIEGENVTPKLSK